MGFTMKLINSKQVYYYLVRKLYQPPCFPASISCAVSSGSVATDLILVNRITGKRKYFHTDLLYIILNLYILNLNLQV